MNLFTTCLRLAGVEVPQDRAIDGLDISPVLPGQGPSPRESFIYYRGAQLYAARLGRFKAHFTSKSGDGPDKPQSHEPPLLFDLGVDPGESFNLATNPSGVIEDIKRLVAQHRAMVAPGKNPLEETQKQ